MNLFKPKGDKLLYLSLASLVFVVSFALSIGPEGQKQIFRPLLPTIAKSNLPVLTGSTSFPILSAQGAIAVDEGSGVSLYEKDADLPLFPASTTKIATALVAMDHYRADEVIEIGRISAEGQQMGLLMGEKLTGRDLFDGLLIYSANDAAEALASAYPGGREAFVAAMNKKAAELNLQHTHFMNPSGLDQDGHVSTARDMIRLAQVAMKNPTFAEIVGTKEKVIKSQDGKMVYDLKNINQLLGKVDGVDGVKTGWTENARENLVTHVKRNGRDVMIAILGSQDRFGETTEVVNWVFSSYTWKEVTPSLTFANSKNQ
ncbi:MAG TPA: D-alanyl-D-alanine carboxypeptidase family protein [Patescibacteria group bacterium]